MNQLFAFSSDAYTQFRVIQDKASLYMDWCDTFNKTQKRQVVNVITEEYNKLRNSIPGFVERHLEDNDIDYADPYNASATRKFASGLSLHSMILKSMGGFMQIEDNSVIPDTLSLKLVIPVGLLDENASKEKVKLEERFFYLKGKPLNLLVADDNDVNLFFVESVIKRFKGKCHSVRDGVEVLNALKENDYDGILLDIQMPRMDGMRTLKEIRQMEGDVSKIPVIAVSAFATEKEKNKIITAGAQKYLGKPFFPNDLYDAISSVFELDKDIPETEKIEEESEEKKATETAPKEDKKMNTKDELISKLKRIDYNDFELRISPNSKTIVKLEEIYNRRYAALDIEVDNCINENDTHKLRETAHSIKGLVGMMSSNQSWELAKYIEQKAAEENMEEAVFALAGRKMSCGDTAALLLRGVAKRLGAAAAAFGTDFRRIILVGGASGSPLIRELLAEELPAPLYAGNPEASAYGNIFIQHQVMQNKP
jgi:CheY-like chemotaxis protein